MNTAYGQTWKAMKLMHQTLMKSKKSETTQYQQVKTGGIPDVYIYVKPRIPDTMFKELPRATLALVASWLIQKDTQESITIKMDGKYVWNTK